MSEGQEAGQWAAGKLVPGQLKAGELVIAAPLACLAGNTAQEVLATASISRSPASVTTTPITGSSCQTTQHGCCICQLEKMLGHLENEKMKWHKAAFYDLNHCEAKHFL